MEIELLTKAGYVTYNFDPVPEGSGAGGADDEPSLELPEADGEDDESGALGLEKASPFEWEKVKLVALPGKREFANKVVKRCWKERNLLLDLTVCVKTKMPHGRLCRETYYLKYRVLSPDEKIRKDVKHCLRVAAVIAAGAFLKGGTAAVKTAFAGSLKVCLEARLGDPDKYLDYRFATEKVCEDWKPI